MKLERVPKHRRAAFPCIFIEDLADGRRALHLGGWKLTWWPDREDRGDPDSYAQ